MVYGKPPFAGPQQVLDYVGRYTHRIAISNNRLLSIEDGKVRFRWKDYRCGGEQKTMTLAADEFIRRFLLHVPPEGFQRIRELECAPRGVYCGALGVVAPDGTARFNVAIRRLPQERAPRRVDALREVALGDGEDLQ